MHVLKGANVTTGTATSGGFETTIEGWIPENALHDDKRDGFDVSVSLQAGTTVRDKPGGAALASARLGALFDRIEVKSNWVHVKRTGWIASTAARRDRSSQGDDRLTEGCSATGRSPLHVNQLDDNQQKVAALPSATTLASDVNGAPVATLEAPLHADVVEHRNGWSRVRIDAWVRDAAVGNAPEPAGITAAAIRAAPDKYVGQTVEWTVQLIGIQKADELRPELTAGQPFLLVRGPLPETGFVYVAVTNEEAETFRKLEPLTKMTIRATVKAGKSHFLPTPVLTFVRRLN